MKLAISFLVLIAVSATLADSSDEVVLPENFFERIHAICKWFDIRNSVYRKANTLLKQLARKVDAMPPFHNGMDIYYNRWISESGSPRAPLELTLLRSGAINNGTRATRTRVSQLVKGMLKEQEVKHVLTMMPEVREAFKRLT